MCKALARPKVYLLLRDLVLAGGNMNAPVSWASLEFYG